ncbi:MAG TPA: tetratricopeptide repeat protein [Verrucomicrobiota bacterium]|nr:tetratricopeptide repeat protein [Verrucomicrobiota bacterium]
MRRDWRIMALLAAATVAVFWQVSRHEFVNFDDPAYVTYNSVVQQGLTWSGVKWAFGQLRGEATYWHPVTWLSHMLDCQFFGMKPAGHHLSSLFLHTLNTVLLFLVLRRMTGRRAPSAVVAALFALHPLQVDSVAWVAERKNVLSTLFFLLTVWAYARYTEGRRMTAESRSQAPGASLMDPARGTRAASTILHPSPASFYLLSLLFFALGLMSKPALVPLPFLLLLLDYWPLQRFQLSTLQRLAVEKVPFLVLSAASSWVTIRGHASLGALASADELPLPFRLANAAVACALYVRKLVWPLDLSVFYLHPGRWPTWAVVGSGLLLLGVTALVVWQARQRPYLIVGWLWFLGMLTPVIGLVQAHVQAMADRFAYLPVIGMFIMLVWAAADWTALRGRWLRGYGLTALAGLVLAGCVVVTCLQLRHWRNSVTLLQRAVRVEPANCIARVMLGNVLFERRQLDDALRQYEIALRLRPDYAEAGLRAGVTLTELGRPGDAIPHLQRAVQLAPAWPEAQRRLALALSRQGRTREANEAYQKLVALMPANAQGRRDLADMLAEGQQFAVAIYYYREAIRLKPDFAEAMNNLAMLRASCSQAEFRNGNEAVQLAEAACRLSGRRNPSFLGTLAAAYAEAGRFPDAVKTMQEALALSRASGANELVPIQIQMLQQFRSVKPWR